MAQTLEASVGGHALFGVGEHTVELLPSPGPEAGYLLTAYVKTDRKDRTLADTRSLSQLVASADRRRWSRRSGHAC